MLIIDERLCQKHNLSLFWFKPFGRGFCLLAYDLQGFSLVAQEVGTVCQCPCGDDVRTCLQLFLHEGTSVHVVEGHGTVFRYTDLQMIFEGVGQYLEVLCHGAAAYRIRVFHDETEGSLDKLLAIAFLSHGVAYGQVGHAGLSGCEDEDERVRSGVYAVAYEGGIVVGRHGLGEGDAVSGAGVGKDIFQADAQGIGAEHGRGVLDSLSHGGLDDLRLDSVGGTHERGSSGAVDGFHLEGDRRLQGCRAA